MKKGIALLLGSLILASSAYACNCSCKCENKKMVKKEMKHKKMMKQKMMKKERPNNIDKNNVGITESEAPDQTDPTLIEGNLENNDFKN